MSTRSLAIWVFEQKPLVVHSCNLTRPQVQIWHKFSSRFTVPCRGVCNGAHDVNFSSFIQVRELFKENVFLSKDPMSRMTLIDATLPKAVQADTVLRNLRREKREATADEQALIDEVEAAREIIIQVCFDYSMCFVRVCWHECGVC